MNTREPNQSEQMADLLESAVAAAHPDRVAAKLDSHTEYRLPLDRLSGMWLDDEGPNSVNGTIQWTQALQAAYQDGYDPIQWIGRGASAEVWRCVDRAFGREVAVKIPCLDADQRVEPAIAALQEEAELLGRLHHPGIVHAVRRSGEGRFAYLALDFVDGDDILQHCNLLKLDAEARCRLFKKVLDAVAYIHAKGIVHGDLKPEHLIVREDNQPVLIDFGLSAYDSSSNLKAIDSGRIGGSGEYRAPEIANGSAPVPAPEQDVYSLGIILRGLVEQFDLYSVGGPIDSIIRRATENQAADRWANAGAMREALLLALNPDPIKAPVQVIGDDQSQLPEKSKFEVRFLLPAVVVLTLLIGVAWAIGTKPEPPEDITEISGNEIHKRQVAQAGLFDLALSDIYADNTLSARDSIQDILDEDASRSSTWEMRHLEAMVGGVGESYPYGEIPYNAHHVICLDYDPDSGSIAYVRSGNGSFDLWVRSRNEPPRLIGTSVEVIRAVAISPGGERLATVDTEGQVIIWTLRDGNAFVADSKVLPRRHDDRILWFTDGGKSLCVFSPKARTVESWEVMSPLSAKPAIVIGDCDHAYPLPSGKGAFMVATSGANTNNGQTQLRLIADSGEVIRHLSLMDGKLPVSADTRPTDNATVCLGMANGFVRIYDSKRDGWQAPCDLGLNEAIPAVVYSESEQRAFAALGRVHVIDATGKLLLRLGDRNAQQQLITAMHFNENSGTLISSSLQKVWECTSPHPAK